MKLFIPDWVTSVHLCQYPSLENFLYDSIVEIIVKRFQHVTCMVRSLRLKTTNATSVTVPLKNVIIACEDSQYIKDLKIIEKYLIDEINYISVIYLHSYGVRRYTLEPIRKEVD